MRLVRVRSPRARVVLAFVSALLIWPASALADWSPVQGTQLNSAGTSVVSLSAASVGGVPYVAWNEAPASNPVSGPVHVSALAGSSFAPVGGVVGSCDEDPVITGIGSTAFLACIDDVSGVIDVYAFTGSSWVQVGPSIPGVGFGAILGGIADVGGEPFVAFIPPYGATPPEVEVYGYSGGTAGTWSQVGASLIGHSGDDPDVVDLLSDGSAPIVAWQETSPVGSGSSAQFVFADQLDGISWSPLNAGNAINPVASGTAALDGLAMIGTTPYLGLDETTGGQTVAGYALALSGSSFAPVGGAIVTSTMGTSPQVALGSYAGAQLAITDGDSSDGAEQLTASTLSAQTWHQLGSRLGVPPLPTSDEGDPYAQRAIVDASSGTPYVSLLQQQNNSTTSVAPEDLFVEAYSPAVVNPNAPTTPKQYPPTITSSKVRNPKLGSVKTPAGVLELADASSLTRRRRTTHLNSGIRAACPSEKRHPACHGEIVLKVKKLQLTWGFTVRSGHSTTASASLSAGSVTQLRRSSGRRIRGTITVTLSGPNAESTSLLQSLHARLP
jgi:hypothetical protein